MRGQPLGDLGTLAVEFEWPFEVANGKWLLYLTKIVVSGESEVECDPPGEVVNLLNLTVRLPIGFVLELQYAQQPVEHSVVIIATFGQVYGQISWTP